MVCGGRNAREIECVDAGQKRGRERKRDDSVHRGQSAPRTLDWESKVSAATEAERGRRKGADKLECGKVVIFHVA